jgi:chromosome segregation and condensation protein ScpB
MDANRREVDKLLSDKRNIERKIEKIQADCKHENIVIKQVANESSFAIRRVCESCGSILGFPSSEEIKNYLEK